MEQPQPSKKIIVLTTQDYNIETLSVIIDSGLEIRLSEEVRDQIKKCREYLDYKISSGEEVFYGINTGFGSLCDVVISPENLQELQHNLVQSHACGTGAILPEHVSKWILLLKIRSLSYGHSGISLSVVKRLVDFYNVDCIPVIHEQGSLGASGDLAPLAHLSLPLIGRGKVYYKNKIMPANKALKLLDLKPIKLKAKEGLALLNGTQFMNGIGSYCLKQANHLQKWANILAAMGMDAFDCKTSFLHPSIHRIRNQNGQIEVAEEITKLLEGSEIAAAKKEQVQDPYSFRCVPQVHGASKDSLAFVEQIFQNEINAVTDNPNIFPDEDLIVSGGNFHGQPLALALDQFSIALAELGNISERRTYQLISGKRDLPEFLVKNPGLHSGLMIPQYTAASIVSQNKQLCSPASVDSIPSCNGQEDHVSMGANGATKALKVLDNVLTILAIELLTATQALEFRNKKSSPIIEDIKAKFRTVVPTHDTDRELHKDIQKSREFILGDI